MKNKSNAEEVRPEPIDNEVASIGALSKAIEHLDEIAKIVQAQDDPNGITAISNLLNTLDEIKNDECDNPS
jgi:hypothetical protein